MDFDYDAMNNIDSMEFESVASCSGWLEIDDLYEWGDDQAQKELDAERERELQNQQDAEKDESTDND